MKARNRYAFLAVILILGVLVLKFNRKFLNFSSYNSNSNSKFNREERGRDYDGTQNDRRGSYDENEEPFDPGVDPLFHDSNSQDIFTDMRNKEAEEQRQKHEAQKSKQFAEADLLLQLKLLKENLGRTDRNKSLSSFGRLFNVNDINIEVQQLFKNSNNVLGPPPDGVDPPSPFINFKSAFSNNNIHNNNVQKSSRTSSTYDPNHVSRDQPRDRISTEDIESNFSNSNSKNSNYHSKSPQTCTMATCFDKSKCRINQDLTVYIYEEAFQNIKYKKSSTGNNWSLYDRIVYIMKQSKYYTTNPETACLFLVPFDTLVRDPLDDEYYIHRMTEKISNLPHWNGGKNHIIFNLYSGTWPAYKEDLKFDFGQAILAKASFSEEFYRMGFDISLPLFKKDQTQFKGVENIFTVSQQSKAKLEDPNTNTNAQSQTNFLGPMLRNNQKPLKIEPLYPASRKYLLTFKGKRYLTGIGSETRNLLYHIHSPPDVVMLTTCKHGKDWEVYADSRCEEDNKMYETYDYDELLGNSTFCLVPRGRRLGSFRFLESLRASCIPVVMANSWVLPFEEVLDWSTALVAFDERARFQAPFRLREFKDDQIFDMRQQGIFLYHSYFSSLEKIILTTLEIIRERVFPEFKRPSWIWNNGNGVVGALGVSSGWSKNFDLDYPEFFDTKFISSDPKALIPATAQTSSPGKLITKFTAVIQVITPHLDQLKIVLKTLENTHTCGQVLLILNLKLKDESIINNLIRYYKKVELIKMSKLDRLDDISERFGGIVLERARYNCILSLDDDVILINDELDYGFSVWRSTGALGGFLSGKARKIFT